MKENTIMESVNFLKETFVENGTVKAVTRTGILPVPTDVENFKTVFPSEEEFYVPFFFKGNKDFLIITKNILSCANILEFITKKYRYDYKRALSRHMIISFEERKNNLDFIIKRLEKSVYKDTPVFIALTDENHEKFETDLLKNDLNLYKITFPSYVKKEENVISEYTKRGIL